MESSIALNKFFNYKITRCCGYHALIDRSKFPDKFPIDYPHKPIKGSATIKIHQTSGHNVHTL